MTIQRLDNVGIVVDDLSAVIRFFVELGPDGVRYGDAYRLCYINGPEGIIVMPAEELG